MLTDQTIDPNQKQKPFLLLRPFLAVWHWMVPPSQAHMDRQSRTAIVVRSSIVIGVSVGFIATVLIWGRDIRDSYQDWRAGRMVKEAVNLANEGNVLNAVMKAQQAYGLSPDNTEAIRLNAKFLTLMGRQEAVFFHELLDKQGAATTEDVQLKVKALMNLNRTKEASDTLGKLMKNTAPTDAIFKLAEDVWGGRGQQNDVVTKVLRDYCEKHPTDNESHLRLARILVASANGADVGEGTAILWRLSENPGDIGIKAIEALDTVNDLSPSDMKRLIALLESHPRANGWHEVAAMKRRISLSPSRRTQIIQEAVMKYQSAERDKRVPFVRWLVLEREFLQVVALVDKEDAKANRDLLENYLTALTLLGRFNDLSDLVEDPKVAEILNKTVRAFYRAHLAFVKNAPKEEVREKLISARIAAQDEGRGDMLLAIARYAEARGIMDVALDAFKTASLNRRMEREGYEGLVRLSQTTGNLPALMEATREAVRRWPDDENFMETHLYASLVAGLDVELALERSLNLLAKRPDDSQVKIAAALGYYWFGDLDMSANHMQRVDLNKCTLGQQAVFAFLAKTCGYPDAAATVVKTIPTNATLLPQEEVFLKRAKEPVSAAK